MSMNEHLGIIELLGVAASISLLSGWRLYLCILATGLAMHYRILAMPYHLASLKVFANPWVMGTAGFAAVCEFLADKVAWIDSIWDTVHTLIRPLGGALLTMAIIDPSDPATQAIAFILGGGGALLAHSGKAGARAVVNTSPEPFSNIGVSAVEDVATGGLIYLAYAHPATSFAIAAVMLVLAVCLLVFAHRVLGRIFGKPAKTTPQ
jgi:hypothetical protein